MKFGRLRRWQWMVVGLLLGALAGYFQTWQDPTVRDGQVMKSIRQGVFEQRLRKDPASIRQVVIDPLAESEELVMVETARGAEFFVAPIPFKPQTVNLRTSPAYGPQVTVRDFLDAAGQGVATTYRWWRAERVLYLACMVIGLLVVGGVWPFVLKAIGWVEIVERIPTLPPASSEPESAVAEAAPNVNLDRLREIEAELQRKADGGTDESVHSDETRITPLQAEPVAAQPEPVKENKSFVGEYYPVARPKR